MFIGICGHPKSGKSEVQKILHEDYGIIPVDDGEVLRQFCINHLGMSYEDVYTQEGKAGYTEILGKRWQNRDILGTLGKQLEDMFGEHIMPFIATRNLLSTHSYSFGSVRKSQGHFFKDRGGIIIEIKNPIAHPSGYEFDKYDPKPVLFTIHNDFQLRGFNKEDGIAGLRERVGRVMQSFEKDAA